MVEGLAVEEESADWRGGGCSIDGSCLEDGTGNGLLDLTEVEVGVINGIGDKSERGPNWGIFLLAPCSLFL